MSDAQQNNGNDWQPESRGRSRSASPRRGNGGRSRSRSPAPRREDENRGRGGRNDGMNPGNNLHVSNLSTRTEDRDLEELFGKYGRIEKVEVVRDPHSRESRGFAFVTMELVEDADAAIEALKGAELLGRVLRIDKAKRARARTPTPGAYHGPPKREDFRYRPYEPSSRYADDRYSRDSYSSRDSYRPRDDYYDDRRGGSSRGYDSRGGYDSGYAVPMRGGGSDYGRRDDRRDRDYDRDFDRRDRYDDRRRY